MIDNAAKLMSYYPEEKREDVKYSSFYGVM